MGLKCKFCDRFPLFGEKYALGQWRDERVDEMETFTRALVIKDALFLKVLEGGGVSQVTGF